MNLPDFHIHTRFSSDSEAEPLDILAEARKRGATAVCFTDHNDFEWGVDENGNKMFQLDFKSYTEYMKGLREKSGDDLKIFVGVEQGLGVSCADLVEGYDPNGVLDFIIGSSHLVDGKDPYEKEFWLSRDIGAAIRAYYESIVANIKACSNYDVYGHLDYIARYIPDKNYCYSINDYMDIIEEILKMLIERGKGIELNTAGLRYGMGASNPDVTVLSLYKQLGGEIITVGSDAHTPADVARYQTEALQYLCEAGFKYYTIFDRRKPVFMPLSV
jgi:histidinol-phosphatase (PHP family)